MTPQVKSYLKFMMNLVRVGDLNEYYQPQTKAVKITWVYLPLAKPINFIMK